MRVIASSFLSAFLILSPAARAENSLDASGRQELNKLEIKYFGHSFAADTDEDRASRLEQLIFGETSGGNPKDRIQHIAEITEAGGSNTNNSERTTDETATVCTTGATAPSERNSAAGKQEKAEKQNGTGDQPDYPRISALERNILGKTYAGQSLGERLSRLECTAFGKPSADPDYSSRADALDRYAEKKLHKKLTPEESFETASKSKATSAPNLPAPGISKAQMFAAVANTVLGASGFGMIPGALGMVPAAMGVLPRTGGAGRSAGMQAAASGQNYTAGDQDEDPAAFTELPPPDEAKLLSKVAWCEVKVFGHTFAGMHLTDRLRQLSRQLQFETNKSDLELMDDIKGFIKTVQAQQSNKPIGSNSQTQ